ncbi:MAG: hypothetical protein QOI95_2879 [Acidimicrobiaceae bacterium]|jgi:hypothetical protein
MRERSVHRNAFCAVTALALIGSVLLAPTAPAQTGTKQAVLFDGADVTPSAPAIDADRAARTRYVIVDTTQAMNQLVDPRARSSAQMEDGRAGGLPASAVTMQLFDGHQVTFKGITAAVVQPVVGSTSDVAIDSPRLATVEWQGHADVNGSVAASAVFAFSQQADGRVTLYGTVQDGESTYVVEQAEASTYGLLDVSKAGVPLADDVISAPKSATQSATPESAALRQGSVRPASGVQQSGVNTVINILVVYSDQVPSSRVQQIAGQVSNTNAALTNTAGSPFQLNLVGLLAEGNYPQASDLGTDLGRLQDPTDGFMDDVAGVRNSLAADLVVLVLPNTASGLCGVAYEPSPTGSESYGFADIAAPCFDYAASQYGFTHEVGHTLGANHNPEAPGMTSSSGPYTFARGSWENGVASDVMTYTSVCSSGCNHTLQYSSPSVDYVGHPGHVSGDSSHDNGTSISLVGPYVANYRYPWSGPFAPPGGNGERSSPHAAATWGATRVDYVVRGTDNAVYWNYWNGSQWSSYVYLGAPTVNNVTAIKGSPAIVSWGPGRLDLFVRSNDDKLWQRFTSNNGVSWSNWFQPFSDGTLLSSPTVASWAPNRLDVFVTGSDGNIYQRFWDTTTWSVWLLRGKPASVAVTGNPAAASWGPNRLDVFVRGSDGKLWQTFWSGSAWATWSQPPGTTGGTIGTPANDGGDLDATSWGSGHYAVFIRGTDNGLYWTNYVGSWSSWARIGTTSNLLQGGPGADSRGLQQLDVFVWGTDNMAYEFWNQ